MTPLFVRLDFPTVGCTSWSVAAGRPAGALLFDALGVISFSPHHAVGSIVFIHHPERAVCKVVTPVARAMNNANSDFFIPCFLQDTSNLLVSIMHTL